MNPLLRLSPRFVLASQSPRRQALLDRIDVPYRVHVSPADETLTSPGAPATVVQTLARRKVEPVAAEHPSAVVLAADTVVSHRSEILNKPESEAHAREMLDRLQGTTHAVYTGIALQHHASDRLTTAAERTDVKFGRASKAEINAYVASGSPMDKAGGYGIQDAVGSLLVEEIEGDYYNVVGLPLHRLYGTLRQHFDDLLALPGT